MSRRDRCRQVASPSPARRRHAPFFLTEHGIYTKERIAEISQADWIYEPERFQINYSEGLGKLKPIVRKDGTVRIDNELFEVNLALRGLRVELELDPWILDPVFVRYKGQDFGRARKVDRHLNARLGGTEDRP